MMGKVIDYAEARKRLRPEKKEMSFDEFVEQTLREFALKFGLRECDWVRLDPEKRS